MADDPVNADKQVSVEQRESKELARIKREEAVMALPAVYIDEFSMIYWKGHIRLSLGEGSIRVGNHWRFSAIIQTRDVKELIERLQGVLAKIEPSSVSEPPQPE
jgi:hypothetical protein